MKVAIDKAGRLVIPKELRNQVGLAPGMRVQLTVDGAGLRIESIAGSGFAERDGFLVIPAGGAALTDADVRDLRFADQA